MSTSSRRVSASGRRRCLRTSTATATPASASPSSRGIVLWTPGGTNESESTASDWRAKTGTLCSRCEAEPACLLVVTAV